MTKRVLYGLQAAGLAVLAAAAAPAWGQAAFAPMQAYGSGGSSPYGLAVGDLNNDGRPDLVTGNYDSSTIGVLLASATAPGTFAAGVAYGTSGVAGSLNGTLLVALGDLNADGRLDVVASNTRTAQVVVLLGSATAPGTLQPAVAYSLSAVGGGTRSLALADVNGDGRLDVAVGSNDNGNVGILLNAATAPGTLGAPTVYGTGGGGNANVALADLTGDGRPDLVVLDRTQPLVRVLPGLAAPAGTFGAPVAYPTQGTLLYGLAVGDVNADGRPDVLTANSSTGANSVSVLLNSATAPGTLLPPITYASGGIGAIELTLGDLNNDGRPDVAVSNQFSNTVGVLLASATAPGTFLPATTYAAGGGPRGLVVADLNRDNRRDIAVTNFSDNNVSVLLNQMPLAAPPALAAAEVTLYPNPARERCAVQVPAVAGAATVRAELLSALGQVVRRQQAALPAAGATLAVPTAGLPAGVYLLRLAALDAQGATLGALPTQRLAVE